MRRWLVEYPRGIPLAVFALIAAITALSVYAIETGERARQRAQLSEDAQTIASAIERRANSASAYLQAGAALFEVQENLSRETFGRFVDRLLMDNTHFGTDGIGWARAIAPTQTLAFEQEVPEVRINPPPPLGQRFVVPVTYLHPGSERNRRALGYDMYSEPVRRAAIDEALRSVRPTASGQVVLRQEGSTDAPGFLIYMPVFNAQGASQTLRGFIYSPFNSQDFLTAALKTVPRTGDTILLYEGPPGQQSLLAQVGSDMEGAISVRQQLTVANRPMELELRSAKPAPFSPMSGLTLLFGLLVASLLLVVVRLLTRQVLEDQAALDWLTEQDAIRDSLTRELNHRVKNALANVLSIISLTRRRASSVDEFADGLDGRVRAMSATHDLLTRSEWGATPLRDIIEVEMAAYMNQDDWNVRLDGPPVQLAPNDALSLGLALHELTTNAGRHGSLSVEGGEVSVVWEPVGSSLVRVTWEEAKGPRVVRAARNGFGLQLIERIVAQQLGQPVELEFRETGLYCTLLVPVRLPSDFALRARHRLG